MEANIQLIGELFDKQQATQAQLATLNTVIEQAQKKRQDQIKSVGLTAQCRQFNAQ